MRDSGLANPKEVYSFLSLRIWALLLLTACSAPHLEELAQALCLHRDECDGERACVDGACIDCAEELCDGYDNDCDGQIDEDFKLLSDPKNCGVCGLECEDSCHQGHCEACSPEDEICDGEDNDCDGEVDEELLNACGECGEPLEEICDGEDNDCDGEIDEGLLNACGECGELLEEICDGEDNDCDGEIDEGLLNACGECGELLEEICDGEDNNCDGVVDEGLLNACGGCGEPPEEICDGKDNNCDGVIDEGFLGLNSSCFAGQGECQVEGNMVCAPDGQQLICNAVAVLGEQEICGDGYDNDCDGEIDEDFEEFGRPCVEGIGACQTQGLLICDPEDPLTLRCSVEALPGQPEICNGLDDNCDGEIDESFDLQNDSLHCGVCGRTCEAPHSQLSCREGVCVVEGCLDQFQDLDGISENGCECNPNQGDEPDPEFLDSNCDGIDGDLEAALFLSQPLGADSNLGTPEAPLASLSEALNRLFTFPAEARPALYIDMGSYLLPETFRVTGPLRIYGGYRADLAWQREPQCLDCQRSEWVIEGANPIFQVEEGGNLHLEELMLLGGVPGAREAALVIRGSGCERIELKRILLQSAPGSSGQDGAHSQPGEPGERGGDGGERGTPGLGGESPCGLNGGRAGGGEGVSSEGEIGGGPGGGLGGSSASLEEAAKSGQPGSPGRSGESGQTPSASGRIGERGLWRPLSAPPPQEAEPGSGGGGGGAGDGRASGIPASGGGGGGGGCPSTAAENGSAGGANLGLLIQGACHLRISESLLRIGPPGAGGRGGDATLGGGGGAPGNPGPILEGEQPGAGGGPGGDGGCGGAGAGGPTGPVLGILRVESPAPELIETLIELDNGAYPGAAGQIACEDQEEPESGAWGPALEQGCCALATECAEFSCPD